MFSTGDVAHGCGHAPRTVYKGIRTTGADFITNDYHRPNVTIQTDTTVDHIALEEGTDGLRATGAVTRLADGTTRTFHARKEVVISSGAYCSPAVLMRSGIGAREELAKFDIPCRLDLPGVGKNLMDHLVSEALYKIQGYNLH
jgi:choline dehydrogenase-like flavoprotein